jgi:uncharacterized protein (TIGR02246 family)
MAMLVSLVATAQFGAIRIASADAAADVAALHAADDTFIKAYNASDADTIAALYDEHAVLLAPGAKAQHGKAAIKAYFAKDVADSAKQGVILVIDPKPAGGVSGNLGWSSGTFSVTDKSGKVLETGKYLSVSRKKDGKWLYVRDTWNTDTPPAAAAPAVPAASPKK